MAGLALGLVCLPRPTGALDLSSTHKQSGAASEALPLLLLTGPSPPALLLSLLSWEHFRPPSSCLFFCPDSSSPRSSRAPSLSAFRALQRCRLREALSGRRIHSYTCAVIDVSTRCLPPLEFWVPAGGGLDRPVKRHPPRT